MKRVLLMCLCTLLLAGCGIRGGDNDMPTTHNTNGNGANALFDLSTMQGSVIEFSDIGCSVTPVSVDADGKTARVASPGNENEAETVHIEYLADCVFQIALINPSTSQAVIKDATIQDIKKQTSLIIYGDYEDAHHLTASKIIIARYER